MSQIQQLVREKAPRPSRRSYQRSLYDAIHAVSGNATLREIVDLIPTTDDAEKWSRINAKTVTNYYLGQAVTAGYLVTIGDRWAIAPLDYYRKAQANAREYKERNDPSRRQTSHEYRDETGYAPRVIVIPVVAIWIVAAFVFGVAVGIVVLKYL